MSIFSLENKIAVVTGANGKLGISWAEGLAVNGCAVVSTDLHENPCDHNARIMKQFPDTIAYCGGIDIARRDDVEKLNEFCKQTFGVANVLVNNAGIDQPPAKDAAPYTIEDYPEDLFCEILRVNAFGTFNMIQVFGNEMRLRSGGGGSGGGGGSSGGGGGSIINIGSLYASVSPDEKFYTHLASEGGAFIKPPSYGMSKAAIVNLTKYLATHWGRFGIRVNTLSPGGVEGGQDAEFKRKFCERVPLGRMAKIGDLVGPLVFLASDASQYVTGIELRVDGGFTAW